MSALRSTAIEPAAERAARAIGLRRRGAARRAAVPIAAVLAALAWAYIEPGRDVAPERSLPVLPERDAACAASEAQLAQRGREARAAAAAKIARYPFAPDEGLKALQLLREAERCFNLAGDRAASAAASAHAQAWRVRLRNDARDHWLRYRVSLASERGHHALPDIEFLLALFGSEAGTFGARLRRARLDLTDDNDVEETP